MSQPRRARMFGTDGIRGAFGVAPLDEQTVRALGASLGATLHAAAGGDRLHVVLGGDTRASTPAICQWLAAGLRDRVEITYLGTATTPCVAWVARHRGAVAGIAVSASHNPWRDNGIKLIDSDGFKWSTAGESQLEEAIAACLASPAATARGSETLEVDHEAVSSYLASLRESLPSGQPLAGLHLCIDAANGAASAFAQPLFESLGAKVDLAHAQPDGRNINRDCGSTHPEVVAARTHTSGADLGIAFDGDADRALFVDEQATVRDGDAVLYLWGRSLDQDGQLPHRQLVATSMSNLGLEVALERDGIGLVRCDVGDRAVVETMRQRGLLLGGEQSGHIVHLGLATTGDGLLTALQVAHLLARAERPFSALLAGFERFPQLIRNVSVRSKPDLATLPTVQAAAQRVTDALSDEGRLVLRYSGTESLARIMIEGRDSEQIEQLAADLALAIAAEIGSD